MSSLHLVSKISKYLIIMDLITPLLFRQANNPNLILQDIQIAKIIFDDFTALSIKLHFGYVIELNKLSMQLGTLLNWDVLATSHTLKLGLSKNILKKYVFHDRSNTTQISFTVTRLNRGQLALKALS